MPLNLKPCLLHVFGVLSVLFCSIVASAQPPVLLVNSEELISEGISLHKKGEYKKALALYRQVPDGDTGYVPALREQMITYMADSGFREAKAIALQALRRDMLPNRRDFLFGLGHAYIYLGQPDSAHYYFDSLIRINRYDYQVVFNKGIVFHNKQRYEEAAAHFQRALMLNPYHFRSHYMLGMVYGQMGRLTEAYLALSTSLLTTNDIKMAGYAIRALSDIAKQAGDVAGAYRARKKEDISPSYEEIDAIINSKLALSPAYKFNAALAGDNTVNTLHAVMEKLQYEAGEDNFAMQFYAPMFTAVYKNESFDPFTVAMFSGYGAAPVEKLAKKNAAEVKDIQEYINAYLDKIVATQTLNYAERKKAAEKYACIPGEDIFIVGSMKSKQDVTFNEGPVTFYKAGVLVTTGAYNAESKKEGEWKNYYASGLLSSVQHYKNGVNSGTTVFYHPNGNIYQQLVFDNKGKEQESREYEYNGLLRSVVATKGGEQILTMYHPNGVKEFEGAMNGDKLADGHYRYYFANGHLKKEFTLLHGAQDGACKEYYEDGGLKEAGNFKDGKKEGPYTLYHNNGQVYMKNVYINDLQEGIGEEYDRHGTRINSGNYRAGKKDGVDSSFSLSGRFYSYIKYRENVPVACYYTDEQGNKVAEAKDESGLKKLSAYFPDGNIATELNYKNNMLNGQVRYYSTGGSLSRTVTYKDNMLHGIMADYYNNGILRTEINYKENEQDGYCKTYGKTGIISSEGWIKNGRRQGIWRFYNTPGKLIEQKHFVNDELCGPAYTYFPDGRLIYIHIYDRDMLKMFTQYDTSGKEIVHAQYPQGNGIHTRKYPNGRTEFTCNLEHGSFQGAYTRYLPNGNVLMKGYYNRGREDSTYEVYSNTGGLIIKGQYKNDQIEGLVTCYDEEGNLWKEQHFVHGEREGVEKIWETGLLRYRNNYYKGVRDSAQVIYGEADKPACVLHYRDGNLTGYTYQGKDSRLLPVMPVKNGTCRITAYYPDEKPSATLELKGGSYHGTQHIYYPAGQKAEERTFDQGDLNGPLKKWMPTGKLAFEGSYDHDEISGKEVQYDSRGLAISTVTYRDGGLAHGPAIYVDPKTHKTLTIYYHYGYMIDAR